MNKPNKTELEYFIRYSLDSDKYKRYMELYDEIERLNKENTILRQNSQYLVKQKDELEEELERLNKENELLKSNPNFVYSMRNNKAIEYCKELMLFKKNSRQYLIGKCMLEKLGGVDKE